MEQLISNGPEKVVFLDVDGVLNSNRSTEPTIAEDMVKRLAHIARKTGASIILSSSWRYEYVRHINPESDYYDKDIDHLITILKKYGLEIADTTPLSYINGANARPYEIRTWLAGRANVKRFAILDDEFWRWNYLEDFVVCTMHTAPGGIPTYGLTDDDVQKAIDILTGKTSIQKQLQEQKEKIVEKLLRQYGMDDIQIIAACMDTPLDEVCDVADRVEKAAEEQKDKEEYKRMLQIGRVMAHIAAVYRMFKHPEWVSASERNVVFNACEVDQSKFNTKLWEKETEKCAILECYKHNILPEWAIKELGLTEEEFHKNEPYSSTDIDNYESAFVITDIPEEKLYQEHFQR